METKIGFYNTATYKGYLEEVGKQLVGKKAQSTILTEIDDNGRRRFQKKQEIKGYEVVLSGGEWELMVILGSDSVYEWTLFNFSR